MKIFFAALILSVFFSPVFSQTIKYEKTFEDALAKASTQKKLIFLVFSLSDRPISVNNKKFESGLDAPDVVNKYNESFICYRAFLNDKATVSLRQRYPADVFPTYFFLDQDGNPISRESQNSSSDKRYIAMADNAIKQAGSNKNLSSYDAIYRAGGIDASFLKEYIIKRKSLGFDDNAQLIDEYVSYLTVKALDNYQEVLFIFKAGPIAYGKAYSLAYTNKKLADSIYKFEPLADRTAMNSLIIKNTYKRAVGEKNVTLAQQLSNFIRTIYRSDYNTGAKVSTQYMISYYQAVKDTINYLQQASYLYDNYYMNISADSARRFAEKQRAEFIKSMNKDKDHHTISDSMKKVLAQNPNTTVAKTTFATAAGSDGVIGISNTLNNAAYAFYLTGTRNPNYILKAITWSRRAIELNPLSGYYDTLAHLLYRYGFYAEAEADQKLAIELTKKENINQNPTYITHLKDELEKIQKRTL
jgi:hypothetical protein